jgi:cbb3-type cytochrome oxidase subunit 1
VIGFIFFFAGFLLTGLTQGTAWLHQGLPVWSVLPGLRPYMALRAIGGALVVISFIMFAYNIFATVIKRKPIMEPTLDLTPIPAE